MAFHFPFHWLLPVLAALCMFLWHQRQQKQLLSSLKNTPPSPHSSQRLLALAVERSWQALLLWLVILGGTIIHDHLNQRKDAIIITQAAEIDELTSSLRVADSQLQNSPSAKMLARPAPSGLSEELQDKLDLLKAQYEELFVTYYYLKRCRLISPSAFHTMNSALLYELSLLDAPAGIRNSILQAARGTHDEMYAQAPCDESATAPLLQNARIYLEQVNKNVSD